MTIDAYPIYRKDLRLLGKQLIGALGIQSLLMIVAVVLINSGNRFIRDLFPTGVEPLTILPKIQVAVSAVVGVVAVVVTLAGK